MAIRVIEEKCKGCALCEKNCPFDAIQVKGQKAVIGMGCTECGNCIENCPFDAIEKTSPEKDVYKRQLYDMPDRRHHLQSQGVFQ